MFLPRRRGLGCRTCHRGGATHLEQDGVAPQQHRPRQGGQVASHAGGHHKVVRRVRLWQRAGASLHPVLLKQHVAGARRRRCRRRAAQLRRLEALEDVDSKQGLHVGRRRVRKEGQERLRRGAEGEFRGEAWEVRAVGRLLLPCAPSCQISAVGPHGCCLEPGFESSGRLRACRGGRGHTCATHHGQAIEQGPLDAIDRHGGAGVLHGATQRAQAMWRRQAGGQMRAMARSAVAAASSAWAGRAVLSILLSIWFTPHSSTVCTASAPDCYIVGAHTWPSPAAKDTNRGELALAHT